MTKKNEKKLVFLDTQVYINNNIDFSNNTFSNLEFLIDGEVITVLITDITKNEIINHINKEVASWKSIINSFKKEIRLLRISKLDPFPNLWKKIELDLIQKDLYLQLNKFIIENQIETVPFEEVSISKVFSNYFESQPPFSEGEKKYEFPDAFVILALEEKSKQTNKKIHIISGDLDFKKACENNIHFKYFDNITKFFDYINLDVDNFPELPGELNMSFEDLPNIIKAIFESNNEIIDSIIEEQFLNLGFYVDMFSSFLNTEYEDVEDIVVQDIELLEKYLTKKREKTLSFKAIFSIDFDFTLSYLDHTDAAYSPELDEYFGSEHVSKQSSMKTNIDVLIEIDDYTKMKDATINKIEILQKDIVINIVDEEYPYK